MRRFVLVALALAGLAPHAASAAPLTADGAVQIALKHSTSMVQANAAVSSASAGMWNAYAGVLPRVDASLGRSREAFSPAWNYDYSKGGGLSGSWSLFSLSSWANWSAAHGNLRSATLDRAATRADVALGTKRQFYEVVKAMHLARVSTQALRLARDDERRVRALFEVGSVSKSDLLKARVRTSQSELDSLLSEHNVTAQRIALAGQIGVGEETLGEIDSTLTAQMQPVDPAAVLADARAARPDLKAAEAAFRAAEMSMRAAQLNRLPSVSASADWTNGAGDGGPWTHSKSASLALSMPVFDLTVEGGIAAARARLLSARETRDALVRNLDSEVRQTLLAYQEASERESLARRTVESAGENLNLVQQKYNVGSATILDLIDSQVQYQRAQSDLVSALAAIRVAEASLERVRGRGV